jgi:heme/copper-type cytochrome/quinol oxidase subunit 4
MSDYWIKTVLASLLLGTGLVSFLTMMARFGRPGDEIRSERLRRRHKIAGYVFIALLAPLAYFGVAFLMEMGDGLSPRGTFHFVLAMALVAVLLLKFLIVKTHRQLLRYATTLGMTLFTLTLIIFLITAGFFILQKLAAD